MSLTFTATGRCLIEVLIQEKVEAGDYSSSMLLTLYRAAMVKARTAGDEKKFKLHHLKGSSFRIEIRISKPVLRSFLPSLLLFEGFATRFDKTTPDFMSGTFIPIPTPKAE